MSIDGPIAFSRQVQSVTLVVDKAVLPPMVVVKMPHMMASVDYRAYAEPLESGSVLDWALGRLISGLPQGAVLACLCDCQSEIGRVRAAYSGTYCIDFLHDNAGSEIYYYRRLMHERRRHRLIVIGLSHVAAPTSYLKLLLDSHLKFVAELTDASNAVFADPFYIVESSLLDLIVGSRLPSMPRTVLPAAYSLRQAHLGDPSRIRSFIHLRVDISKGYASDQTKWPEKISLRSKADVELLRNAITTRSRLTPAPDDLIVAWKQVSVEANRLIRQVNVAAREFKLKPLRRRIRILYGSSIAGFTGAQQSLCHLIGALDQSRYEPIALVPYTGTFTTELQKRGATVISPLCDFTIPTAKNLLLIDSVLRQYAPDIIHSNHNIGFPLAFAIMSRHIPLVQHVRYQWPRGLRELIHAADAVIAVSQFVRDRIAELDIDLDKVVVIWNGVDVNDFVRSDWDVAACRSRLRIPLDAFVVTMVARMAAHKRHDIAIDAVAALRASTGRGHLLIVGEFDGDHAYVQRVRQQIVSRRLRPHVSMVPFLADIRPALYSSDVVVLPSEDEPLARAALEAMAAGLPVVVADSGGTREVITHGKTGLIVRYGHAADLASALLRLANDPSLATSLGAKARETAQQSLTATECADKTMRVYEKVLRRQTPFFTLRSSH